MLDIQEMIVKDSKVNMSEIAEESIKVISLHAKYLGLWQEEKTKLLQLEEIYKKLKCKKVEYYLGKANDEVYEKEPFHLKLQRQDLDFYLDADNDLCNVKRNLVNSQNKIELIKSFIDHNLNQRSHHFRNALAFLNWSQGK